MLLPCFMKTYHIKQLISYLDKSIGNWPEIERICRLYQWFKLFSQNKWPITDHRVWLITSKKVGTIQTPNTHLSVSSRTQINQWIIIPRVINKILRFVSPLSTVKSIQQKKVPHPWLGVPLSWGTLPSWPGWGVPPSWPGGGGTPYPDLAGGTPTWGTPCPDLEPVTGVPPKKGHGASGSIMGWRWCTPPQKDMGPRKYYGMEMEMG